jgi:hypothetical protein
MKKKKRKKKRKKKQKKNENKTKRKRMNNNNNKQTASRRILCVPSHHVFAIKLPPSLLSTQSDFLTALAQLLVNFIEELRIISFPIPPRFSSFLSLQPVLPRRSRSSPPPQSPLRRSFSLSLFGTASFPSFPSPASSPVVIAAWVVLRISSTSTRLPFLKSPPKFSTNRGILFDPDLPVVLSELALVTGSSTSRRNPATDSDLIIVFYYFILFILFCFIFILFKFFYYLNLFYLKISIFGIVFVTEKQQQLSTKS